MRLKLWDHEYRLKKERWDLSCKSVKAADERKESSEIEINKNESFFSSAVRCSLFAYSLLFISANEIVLKILVRKM